MEVEEEEDYIVMYVFVLRCTGPGLQNMLWGLWPCLSRSVDCVTAS